MKLRKRKLSKKTIGNNIRYLRVKHSMSIQELAETLKISTAFMGLIERGQRGTTLKCLTEIINLFGVSMDELLYEDMSSAHEKGNDYYTTQEYLINGNSALMQSLSNEDIRFVAYIIRGLIEKQKAGADTSDDNTQTSLDDFDI